MIIAYLSDDKRGPHLGKQRQLIKDAGIEPDREIIGEEASMLPYIVEEGDQIVVAHAKAFVGPKVTAFVLDMAKRKGATIVVAGAGEFDPRDEDQFAEFLGMSSKRWRKFGTRSKANPGQGRPTEYAPPTGSIHDMLKRMWWKSDRKFGKEGYTAAQVLDFASDALGYEVTRNHMNFWISNARTEPEDGLSNLERKQKKEPTNE